MKSQQRDDLAGLIREESLRRWVCLLKITRHGLSKATMQVPFVQDEEPHRLSELGSAWRLSVEGLGP